MIRDFTRSASNHIDFLARKVYALEDAYRAQGLMISELLKVTQGHKYPKEAVEEFERFMIAMNLTSRNIVRQVDASGV